MDKIAFLSAEDIKHDFLYPISYRSAKKRFDILINNTNQPAIIVENFKGKFYVNENFKNFAVLKKIDPKRMIPCLIIHNPVEEECDRLLRVLSKSILERPTWKIQYELIQRLTREFHLGVTEIAKEVNVKDKEIGKFMLEPNIPDYYKSLAIKKGYGGVMNLICKSDYTDELKKVLYDLAVADKHRLTEGKFKSLKRYTKMGYLLTQNKNLIRRQIIKIVEPKDYIENVYWDKISGRYSQESRNQKLVLELV
ncbi:hypothetical protein J8TS2_37160 [Lederbergia ruris]|uniref:GIY-YIG homing endonuclease n=1 Tax=Lederbergia ruris TaxID=217495 RepID=A0ABQ4KN85_9BACI|nr:hypothetical protein [Lederbergia ruris]GIN59397.1 hypothetical protein J8TS2_37160 [Lederbergia ruris]